MGGKEKDVIWNCGEKLLKPQGREAQLEQKVGKRSSMGPASCSMQQLVFIYIGINSQEAVFGLTLLTSDKMRINNKTQTVTMKTEKTKAISKNVKI